MTSHIAYGKAVNKAAREERGNLHSLRAACLNKGESSGRYATSLSHAPITSACSAGKNESPMSRMLRMDRYIN